MADGDDPAAAIEVLRIALDTLADHYVLPTPQAAAKASSRVAR